MSNIIRTTLLFTALLGYGTLAAWPLFHKVAVVYPPLKVFDEQVSIENRNYIVTKPLVAQKGLVLYIEDKPIEFNSDKSLIKRIAELSYNVVKISWSELNTLDCNQQLNEIRQLTSKLQLKFNIPSDRLPIVVTGQGASPLVYSLMQQQRFHAGISLHMQNQFSESASPSCPSPQQDTNLSASDLHANWYIFNEPSDSLTKELREALNKVPNAKFTLTDMSDKAVEKEAIQILQWLDPRLKDQLSSAQAKGKVPIIEVPVTHSADSDTSNLMAVFLTGDGGWAAIDKNVAKAFADKGIPTLGIDSLSYFWKARTPQETAQDIEGVANHYLNEWKRAKIILIGYSFGADVMPFLLNRFSGGFNSKIDSVVLLSMGKTAAFEFKLSSWMNADKRPERSPTLPELQKVKSMNIVCVYGLKDPDSVCSQTTEAGAIPIGLPGNHHFNDDYPLLMNSLFQHIPKR